MVGAPTNALGHRASVVTVMAGIGPQTVILGSRQPTRRSADVVTYDRQLDGTEVGTGPRHM